MLLIIFFYIFYFSEAAHKTLISGKGRFKKGLDDIVSVLFGNKIGGNRQNIDIVVMASGLYLFGIYRQARTYTVEFVGDFVHTDARTANNYPAVIRLDNTFRDFRSIYGIIVVFVV